MARRVEVSHATLDEVCETVEDLLGGPRDVAEPLLFKYDDVYLDVESISVTDNGTLVIHLQEA